MHIKSRAQALRELSKYSIVLQMMDFEPAKMIVRPKGWNVELAEMSSVIQPLQVRRDMEGFYKAVAFLANKAAPPERKRKAKRRR